MNAPCAQPGDDTRTLPIVCMAGRLHALFHPRSSHEKSAGSVSGGLGLSLFRHVCYRVRPIRRHGAGKERRQGQNEAGRTRLATRERSMLNEKLEKIQRLEENLADMRRYL